MKITEKTTIGELIPEGYKLEPNPKIGDSTKISTHSFYIKKKEVKDFKWYVNEYLSLKTKQGFVEGPYHINISDYSVGIYDKVPFEFKIGLLKFICDDLGIDLIRELIHYDLSPEKWENAWSKGLSKICPAKFLNSIFK